MSYIPALCKTGCPARSKRIIPFWAVKLTGISAFERIDMTEFEVQLLGVLNGITRQLGSISDNISEVSNSLQAINNRGDWGYEIDNNLGRIAGSLDGLYEIAFKNSDVKE